MEGEWSHRGGGLEPCGGRLKPWGGGTRAMGRGTRAIMERGLEPWGG